MPTLLTQDTLLKLHKAALETHLADQRDALWTKLDPAIKASSPSAPNLNAQILSDLNHLNSDTFKDGSTPLIAWLRNAQALTKAHPQTDTFTSALTTLATKTSPPPPKQHITKLPPRNHYFQGREPLLTQLHTALQTQDRAALTQAAIAGLGGIGKTSLATEYVHRHKANYTLIGWLNAEDETKLSTDFAALTIALRSLGHLSPGIETQTVPTQVTAVKTWLTHNKGWLLIFDNATHPETLDPYRINAHQGHILITSRNPNWDEFAPTVLTVPTMPRQESVAFLQHRTDQDNPKAAHALAKELGDLPLALAQAAAYIKTTRISLTKYLNLFNAKTKLQPTKAKPPRGYPHTVATTWALSFEKVQLENNAAGELLNLLAFFAPTDIPLFLLRHGHEHLPTSLANAAQDEESLIELQELLCRYSLIEADHDLESLSIHRLVQAVVRDAVDDHERWATTASRVVHASYPVNAFEYEHWPHAKRLLEHAQAVIDGSQCYRACDDIRSHLLTGTGHYLHSQGQFTRAKRAHEQALELDRKLRGEEHPDTLTSINNLASTLYAQGDLNGARLLQEKALEVQTRVLGPEHSSTLTSINNLAQTLYAQGDLNGARLLQEKALEVRTRVLGPEHPSTLTSINNLAQILFSQGDLNGARQLLQKALEVTTRVLGPEHPDTLTSINNLASTLYAQGGLNGARQLEEKALEVITRVLGPTHENTTISQWNLLQTLMQTQAPPQDISTLRQSLTWLLQAPDHTLSAIQRDIRDMFAQMIEDPQT